MPILRLSERSFGALENDAWERTGKWLEHALSDLADRSPEAILEGYRPKLSEISQHIVSISRRYGFMLRDDVLQLAKLQLQQKESLSLDVLAHQELTPRERLSILKHLASDRA